AVDQRDRQFPRPSVLEQHRDGAAQLQVVGGSHVLIHGDAAAAQSGDRALNGADVEDLTSRAPIHPGDLFDLAVDFSEADGNSGSLPSCPASAGSTPPIRPPPESITMSPAKLRSIAELTDAVLEDARMVMNPTSPTPIISAEALAAVRLGLRMAF